MKKIYTVLVAAMVSLSIQSNAQVNSTLQHKPLPKPNNIIPFGKKLPPPNLTIFPGNSLPDKVRSGMHNFSMQRIKDFNAKDIKKNPAQFKQQILQMHNNRYALTSQNKSTVAADFTNTSEDNSDFHLTKDINSLAESFPYNSLNQYQSRQQSYAVLNDVIYFAADDGIHGAELWRSDGTNAGTYMLKDIMPGSATSFLSDITAVNGKLYFDAYTPDYGYEPWVSDGTQNGTQLLMDIMPGTGSSFATEFVAFHNRVYFATGAYQDALWKTDGTTSGTKEVADIGQGGNTGYILSQVTAANNLLFFTFYNFDNGWQLWRSDGTNNGTYNIGANIFFLYVPAQLTKYANELYFSADDGSGRKLWVSDGTDAGTTYAPNNNDVLIDADYFGIKFQVLNNVLYMPGLLTGKSDALYKYDASTNDGLVKVTSVSPRAHSAFIIPSEMTVVHNSLYFKVTDFDVTNTHDELWSSDGSSENTQRITKFLNSEAINNLYNVTGTLYFVKYDKTFGTELWKLLNSAVGSFPIPESDVFKGPTSSYPAYLTAFNDKLFFSATDDKKGNELIMTNNTGIGATVVKDINTTSTSSSYAGEPNSVFITAFGNQAVFDAIENVHGDELYKSDGTEAGTILLNDIMPGEVGSAPHYFLSKNNHVYFVAAPTDSTFSIYKTNGTKSGLKKITPDYDYNYFFLDFKVADNGIVFYTLFSFYTFEYQLWSSDGTASGTYLLSSSLYNNNYFNVAGNTAFFVAGDDAHGYELWKSNGSIAGTKMVKDINPGSNGSYPGGMFVSNNEVYFGANNGTSSNGGSGAGFWKSDGTEAGTIKLKDIDPWWGGTVEETTQYFCASNNTIYFSALNYNSDQGTKLWKTDGTPNGTQVITDTKPNDGSLNPGPFNLTDVNGTVFFTDFFNVNEVWKSDGTAEGTKIVKSFTSTNIITTLVNYNGKLYFIETVVDEFFNVTGTVLWSSDGTGNGTQPVNDPVINQLQLYNMLAAGNQLFLSGSNYQYGIELYAGTITDDGKFVASSVTNSSAKTVANNILLYPNPVKDVLNINTGSLKTSKAMLQVTNTAGAIVMNRQVGAFNKQNVLQLNVSKLASGAYFIKIISADGTKISVQKFEKQ